MYVCIAGINIKREIIYLGFSSYFSIMNCLAFKTYVNSRVSTTFICMTPLLYSTMYSDVLGTQRIHVQVHVQRAHNTCLLYLKT